MFSMAWSPVRRTNAGRLEVDHPGDYATLNSYHPVDGTAELRDAGLCRQEEAHEARRVSSRDGGGGAVVNAGSSDRAALSEGGPSRRPSSVSDRRDVAHLLPAAVVQSV